MKKVITYGTYDLLQNDQIRLFERAKQLGDYLIVGITSDDYDKTRGRINNQQSLMERIAGVEATGLADEIIVEEYEGQRIDDIKRLNVDIFTVGSDWTGKFDYLNEYCKVVYLPCTEDISRSEQRQLRIGTIGDGNLCNKFVREMEYVNGVEYVACDDTLEGVDAVYVVSHPERHYHDVKRALNAGKHVICESPIALKVEQYRELRQLAADKGLALEDAIKTAYSTAYSRLLVLAKSGRIGDIVSVDAVCTSLGDGAAETGADLSKKQNSICDWGPTAMLPVFQLLGTDCRQIHISSIIIDEALNYDGFTKIDFLYKNAIASVKVAKAAKAEGELIISGTKGYIYVPAPWWKTDYFELRFEDPSLNKRYFYQLDGEGIRYEIAEFAKTIKSGKKSFYISEDTTEAIITVVGKFYDREYTIIRQ